MLYELVYDSCMTDHVVLLTVVLVDDETSANFGDDHLDH